MTRDQALTIIQAHREELEKDYAVKSLALFGSVVRNEATADSDVDVLVEFSRPVGMFHFIGTGQHLEALLKAKVDLVLRRAVLPELRERIFKESVNVF